MLNEVARGHDRSVAIFEPAQPPLAIQPHGILLVLSEAELRIEYVSENLSVLIGRSAGDVCGAGLQSLMSKDDARAFAHKLRQPDLNAVNPCEFVLNGAAGRTVRVESAVQRRPGGGFIVEFEPAGAQHERDFYAEAQAPLQRLQSAPGVTELLASAAHDVQALSGFDRVVIFRFDADWQYDAVAEVTAGNGDEHYLGRHFGAGGIDDQTRAGYLRNTIQSIPDTAYIPAKLIGRTTSTNPRRVDLARAMLRCESPAYLRHLSGQGVRGALTISLVVRGRLWGAIACYHSAPRRVRYAARMVLELMGHMLAWQLGARGEAELRERRARETALQTAIGAELESVGLPCDALMARTPELLELFGADGVAIRAGSTIARSGTVPSDDATLTAIAAILLRQTPAGDVAASDHLAAIVPDVHESMTFPAGALCIRLSQTEPDFLLLFRPEFIRTVNWAVRNANAGAAPHVGAGQARPEIVRGRSRPWTSGDLAAAQTLAARISARRQRLIRAHNEQVFHVNTHLEERNAQAEALIKLQDDVAAALPSRDAVIEVILQFAQRQTRAAGSVLETLTERDIVFTAAIGSLAAHVGFTMPRAGSCSAASAERKEALVCNDAATDLNGADLTLCRQLEIGSMLVVPIATDADHRAVIKVVSPAPWAFNDDDTRTLKLAATHLTSALRAAQEFAALAKAEQEQRAFAQQLRALHAIASTTTSHGKEQIDAALHLGLEQLGLDWAFLGVIDFAAQEFIIESSVAVDAAHLVVPRGTRLALGQTFIGRIAQARQVVIVEDVSKSADLPAYAGWSSHIAVPLVIDGKKYGAIGFTSRLVRPQPFSEANIEFLAVAGELIASAIERGLQRDQLEHSQRRYRALIEAIPQMMWVVDANNDFEYVNERWTQYTGLSLEQSRAAGRERVYDAADLADGGLRRPLPRAEYDCEVRLRRADGAYRWHLVRSMPFRSVAVNAEKWLVTATDIEARKSAETLLADVHDAALAATEAKSRFLATMSHEIRTPMNGVIGMTELMLLTPLNDEQREYTEVIRDSGQSLLRVLNDILDYSKIEAGKLELEDVQFDLPGQVESVVELLRPGFMAKGVTLSTHIAPDVRTAVVGDPGRLRQILLNLTGNALKFTAPGGSVKIDVSTSIANDTVSPVRFKIADTGIGIPPDVLGRLFQPFSQGDESTTRKYGGTGLGLSISAELVALMDGRIGVESIPDIGSEFWFTIPLRLAPNSPKVADTRRLQPARTKPAPMRSERILVVEDNEINTFLALKQLQRLGFAVTAVTNGLQAVETIGREHYDLVLMDCHMPEMDGFEATRAIRRLAVGNAPRLPIVAMTADARDEDHQNCLLAGMDDYISKPTNLDSLKAVLDRWLPARERRRASRNGAPPPSTAPLLGMSMLLELFDNDRSAVFGLLAAALGTIQRDVKRIEAASTKRDFDALIEAAHRLKGTSGSIRSGRLVEISAAIETEARAQPAVISPALLAELRGAVVAVTAEIEQQRITHPSSSR